MDNGQFEPRSGIPAMQMVLALCLALIVAGGGLLWVLERAQRPASAVLAFAPDAARHLDPALLSARYPAVAFADSILTDSVVAKLAKTTMPSTSKPAVQTGEFRASLQLTQPSPRELRIRFVTSAPASWVAMLHAEFLDIGTRPSAATANAVAQALMVWTPAHAPAEATTARTQPSGTPPAQSPSSGQATPPEPMQAAAPKESPAPHPIADGLGEVGALLSATSHDLDGITGAMGAGHRSTGSSYMQSRQQHLLNTQIRAAERKVGQLTAQDTTTEVKARLRQSQDVVRSILAPPGTQHLGHFNSAGTSASELRRERTALLHAIAVVEQERQAISRIESAVTAGSGNKAGAVTASGAGAPDPSRSGPADAASLPESSNRPSSLPQEQNLPPSDAANSTVPAAVDNPLTVIRPATPAEQPRLWVPVAAGLLCGLLYLGFAALVYRRSSEDAVYQDSGFSNRFITPAEPIHEPGKPSRTAEHPDWQTADDLQRRRTAFALQSHPAESVTQDNAPLSQQAPIPVAVQQSPVTQKEHAGAEDAAAMDRLWKILAETPIERVLSKASAEEARKPPESSQGKPANPNRLVS